MDLKPLKLVWTACFDGLGVYDRHLKRSVTDHLWFIPFYHRILEDGEEEPFDFGLGVQRRRFDQQLAFFRERFHVCTVREALDIQASGSWPDRPLLSITFDDGYLDNIDLALPLLRRHDCPATFFICTGPIESGQPFWWDRVMAIAGRSQDRAWQDLLGEIGMTADVTDPKTELEEALTRLWQLPFAKIEALLGDASDDRTIDVDCPPRMDKGHLQILLDHGMELAAHTHNHPNLTKETDETIRREIDRSRKKLEAWTGEKITGFATPHGFVDDRVKRLCREEGMAYIASTDSGANRQLAPYHLARFGAADTNLAHLKRTLARLAA
ncbi:MAG: polysaccharide deacetylase family protein [Geminicoccaceae bacterium]